MEAPIFKGSRSTQSGPCLAGVFSLCFRLLFTFWVTPENELAKRYLRYSHLFYRRILRVPKRLTPSPCSQHFKILCIGPVSQGDVARYTRTLAGGWIIAARAIRQAPRGAWRHPCLAQSATAPP